jgi:hypothetical protein
MTTAKAKPARIEPGLIICVFPVLGILRRAECAAGCRFAGMINAGISPALCAGTQRAPGGVNNRCRISAVHDAPS